MSAFVVTPRDSWPTFKDVLKAYKECRVGKPASIHQSRFEAKLGENLWRLHKDIHSKSYKPSRATAFVVTHPKPREIFASHFRDRIVHHLIVSKLQPIWEPKFSPFSFACRKGRGTHGALLELQRQGYNNVYQLEGGIINYMEKHPEDQFEGECFVFDQRVALDAELKPSTKYGLCPHCGQPAATKVECKRCDTHALICDDCEKLEWKNVTCCKNCAYQFQLHPERKGVKQKPGYLKHYPEKIQVHAQPQVD